LCPQPADQNKIRERKMRWRDTKKTPKKKKQVFSKYLPNHEPNHEPKNYTKIDSITKHGRSLWRFF